jgi:HD superfamily phosphodiesterase
MNKYFNIINNYNLDDYLSILLKHNTANNAAYHNFYHTLCVVKNALDIMVYEGFTKDQERMVLLACLFHDFNHSQGKLSDDKNVEIAIDSFLKYSKETEEINNEIVNIIKATQYPYIIPDEELNIYQKIIRDADLMQIFSDNYFQQNIISLGTIEMNKSLEDSIDLSLNFYKNLKFHTNFAKVEHQLKIKNIILRAA